MERCEDIEQMKQKSPPREIAPIHLPTRLHSTVDQERLRSRLRSTVEKEITLQDMQQQGDAGRYANMSGVVAYFNSQS